MEQDRGTSYPTQGRRSVSRATKLRRRKQRMNFVLLLSAIAAIILLVIVLPLAINGEITLESRQRAPYSVDSGTAITGDARFTHYQGLVISEVMPSNSSSVSDENGNYPDWVEIWNHSNEPVSLVNIGLSDNGKKIKFLFPDITLEADGRIVVYCDNTNQAAPNKPLHAKFKLGPGNTVFLYDPKAYLIDSLSYPIMASNESYALVSAQNNKREYQIVTWDRNPGRRRRALRLDRAVQYDR